MRSTWYHPIKWWLPEGRIVSPPSDCSSLRAGLGHPSDCGFYEVRGCVFPIRMDLNCNSFSSRAGDSPTSTSLGLSDWLEVGGIGVQLEGLAFSGVIISYLATLS